MAYVLGFFSADGNMNKNKRGGQFWSIEVTDGDLLEKIKYVMGSEHKISVRIQKKKTHKPLYRLQIGSFEMCDDLRLLGFTNNKTKSLSIPSVPQKYVSDFVRGYFDGDGNVWCGEVHKERKTRTYVLSTVFTSGSKKFLLQLQSVLFVNLSCLGSISKRKGKECWCLRYSVRGSLKLCDFMYNSHVSSNMLLLTRKKQVFEKYKKMQS